MVRRQGDLGLVVEAKTPELGSLIEHGIWWSRRWLQNTGVHVVGGFQSETGSMMAACVSAAVVGFGLVDVD